MTPAEYEMAWLEIEAAVAPLELDPSLAVPIFAFAAVSHPLAEQIAPHIKAGELPGVRIMDPDLEALERGEDVPIVVQFFYGDPAGADFLSVMTTPVSSFAAGALE